jgi:hypothetical protein
MIKLLALNAQLNVAILHTQRSDLRRFPRRIRLVLNHSIYSTAKLRGRPFAADSTAKRG